MKILHSFGILITWISIIVAALGIILGLRHLVIYHELSDWWTAVPASFLGLFIGVGLTYLAHPDLEDHKDEH